MTTATQDDTTMDATETRDALIELDETSITLAEIGDPHAFLESDRGKAWLKPHLDGAYFSAYYDYNRGPYDMKFTNAIASDVLDAKKAGGEPCEMHDVVEAHFSEGSDATDTYYEDHSQDVKTAIEEIAEQIEALDLGLPEPDMDEWEEAVRDRMVEHMEENDDTSILDLISTSDTCEIVVHLHDTGNEIECDWRTSCLDTMTIDRTMQLTMAALGYSIADYRRMSTNKRKSDRLVGGIRKRAQPLLTEHELRELIENAGHSHFDIVLYAIVPLRSVIDLDVTRPFTLDSYAIAAYNSSSGTFHEMTRKEAIVIMPGEGFIGTPRGYSPADICGLSTRYYEAKLENV